MLLLLLPLLLLLLLLLLLAVMVRRMVVAVVRTRQLARWVDGCSGSGSGVRGGAHWKRRRFPTAGSARWRGLFS